MIFRLLSFLRIFLLVFLFHLQLSAQDSCSSNLAVAGKEKKWFKSFFSLQNSDSIRTFSKITTASDETPPVDKKWGITVGGYIGTDLFWDTRNMVMARDGLLGLYPAEKLPDINGRDVNATPSFNFLVLNTRVNLRIKVPDALGAKISGMIEGWFAGVSNSDANGFSMRHSFIKLDWKTTSLLIGQTWHPLFTESCFANTVAGSAGSPFQPFSRAPQIRLNQQFAKTSNLLIYINSQRDFLSTGSNGNSSEYLRNSAIPEMGMQYFLDLKYKEGVLSKNRFLVGIGGDYKRLIPRQTTLNVQKYTRKAVNAFSALLYTHYAHHFSDISVLGVKAKAFWGQSANEFLMTGGYAVKFYDYKPLNPQVDYQYTPLNTLAAWIDLYTLYRSWEFGLFGGYSQNMGSFSKIQAPYDEKSFFARGHNIDFMYRISARVKYTANSIQFAVEPEYTVAQYGNTLNAYGKVIENETERVGNLRLLFSVFLFF